MEGRPGGYPRRVDDSQTPSGRPDVLWRLRWWMLASEEKTPRWRTIFVRHDVEERHNGVFGGCWCTWFHTFHAEKTFTAEGNRALKQRLVDEGRAHAALVFDGDEAVAWCEYGNPEELPNIYHRTATPCHRHDRTHGQRLDE